MLLPFGIRPDRDIACTITYRGTQCLHALTTWPFVGALDVRRTPTGQAHKNVYGAFGALLSHVQCCRSLCGRSLPNELVACRINPAPIAVLEDTVAHDVDS
jgi:hypothetical protein